MISFPNTKINIGLSIVSKRIDGFHNLESIFYPINWCDVLEIIPAVKTSFTFSGITIPGDPQKNLCLQAYELLRKEYDLPPVAIHLKKLVPIGAGLGGGSADASYTLKMLNELFDLQLTTPQLQQKARLLGSDCAFFIENKPVLATEKGDVFTPSVLSLKGYYLLLVNPNIHISTQEAYNGILPKIATTDYVNITNKTWLQADLKNDFEEAIFINYPQIKALKEELYTKGAIYSAMTGSGSTVFGIFKDKPIFSYPKSYSVYLEKL